MTAMTRILVPVDRDNDRPSAPDRARRLARHQGGSVTLLSVVPELPWYARLALSEPEAIDRAFRGEEMRRLEGLAEAFRSDGVPVELRIVSGSPSLSIVREVIRGGHDLLLKDAGSPSEGSSQAIDRQILRTCPCPVWLSRPGRERNEAGRERLLALVDPAPLGTSPATPETRDSVSVAVLDLADTLVESEGFEPIVAHVWDATGQGLLRSAGYTDEQVFAYVEEVRSGVSAAMERLLAPHRDRIGPDAIRMPRGFPSEVIPRLVEEEGIDLIVMGTMARSGIAGMLIGNTAETIENRVNCSILAVKPGGFVSPVDETQEIRPS